MQLFCVCLSILVLIIAVGVITTSKFITEFQIYAHEEVKMVLAFWTNAFNFALDFCTLYKLQFVWGRRVQNFNNKITNNKVNKA